MKLSDRMKIILIEKGLKDWPTFNKYLNEKFNTNYTVQNLHLKFKKETIKYKELEEIMDAIGYEIVFQPKEKK